MQKFTFALSKRFRPKHNVPVRENKLFIGTGSILAGDKSCVLPTEPHLLKKKCPWTQSMTGGPWTQSMKMVHGPSPCKVGSCVVLTCFNHSVHSVNY